MFNLLIMIFINYVKSFKNQNLEGIIFLQTLSWLNNYKKALLELAEIGVKWISLSSLFYEGLIEAEINIKQYKSNNNIKFESPYNVLSIPIFEKYFMI